LTDPLIGSTLKGGDFIAALEKIRKAEEKPKISAKDCFCAPKLKGFNDFIDSEVLPADEKSNFILI
jgi:hypothetical protein